MTEAPRGLSWAGIVRLGLVQTALGAIVVLATATLNRVMVVELALAAAIPGALFALHHAVQISRPRWGYGSDRGGRRTPWIVGGMAVLALGGTGAAAGTLLMGTSFWPGLALALLAYAMIGLGAGAAGTSLLALLATEVAERRRAAAASIVWIMMIAGFVVTATGVGAALDPYSPGRLLAVVALVAAGAFLLALLAVLGMERTRVSPAEAAARPDFTGALRGVWAEPQARTFTIFVFVSMLAYSTQDLILEPFAGHVFLMSPGESTALSGVHHGGVLLGMILVGIGASGLRLGSMRVWSVAGCLGSAAALGAIVLAGLAGPPAPLRPLVFALGLGNGVFAVAAIASMMGLAAGAGARAGREGTRMGLWGAAQAIAFGIGGFGGAAAVDLARLALPDHASAYGLVFVLQALLFLAAAALATRIGLRAAIPANAIAGE